MPKSPGRWSSLRRITTASHRYLPEVDGLRFIAIFSVLFFHVFYAARNVPGAAPVPSRFDFLFWPVSNGHRGVELFFVISGFILSLPFAAHHLNGANAVKVGRFYLRRLTRLEPPYILALLLFYTAAVLLHDSHANAPGFFSGLFLRLGYAHGLVRNVRPTLDGVTWTLEIEVQFYLLAPLLAQIFRLAAAPRRLILIAAICLAPLLAPIVPRFEMTFLRNAQFFLAGFLLADLHSTGTGLGKCPQSWFDLLAIGSLLVLTFLPDCPAFALLFPWLLSLLFLGALRGRWLTAILRRPLIATLGGMCYSLYLLHYPIYSFIAAKVVGAGMTLPMACWRVGLLGLPLAVGAGIIYYILIERPCMNPDWPRLLQQRLVRWRNSMFGIKR